MRSSALSLPSPRAAVDAGRTNYLLRLSSLQRHWMDAIRIEPDAYLAMDCRIKQPGTTTTKKEKRPKKTNKREKKNLLIDFIKVSCTCQCKVQTSTIAIHQVETPKNSNPSLASKKNIDNVHTLCNPTRPLNLQGLENHTNIFSARKESAIAGALEGGSVCGTGTMDAASIFPFFVPEIEKNRSYVFACDSVLPTLRL